MSAFSSDKNEFIVDALSGTIKKYTHIVHMSVGEGMYNIKK